MKGIIIPNFSEAGYKFLKKLYVHGRKLRKLN